MKGIVFIGWLFILCGMEPNGVAAGRSDLLSLVWTRYPERDTNRMQQLYRLAVEKRVSDTQEAEKLVQEGYEIACENNCPEGIAEGLRLKAGLKYRKADYPEAEKDYRAALEIALKNRLPLSSARIRYDLGVLYSRISRGEEALPLFEEALPVFREYDDKSDVVKCLFNLGKVSAALHQPSEAMDYYIQALSLAEEWKLRKEEALVYSNIGALYFNLGEKEKALEYFRKVLPVYRELGDRGLLAGALQQLGTVCIALKNYEEAAPYLKQSLDLFRQLGYKNQMRHALNSLGVLAKKQGKFAEALPYYDEITRFGRESRDTTLWITGLINKSSLYVSLKDYRRALEDNQRAEGLAQRTNMPDKLAAVYENMSYIYAGLQRYREALEWHKRYKKEEDLLFTQEKHRQIEELNTRYDVERKELKIKNLETENLLQQLSLRHTRMGIVGVGILLAVVSGLLFFLRRQYLKTREASRQLVLKNQQIIQQQEKFMQEKKETERFHKSCSSERKDGNGCFIGNNQMIKELEELIIRQEIFKDSELTLNILARKLNTNTTYLSRLVNEYYGQNFSAYINTFRINAAQRMLVDPECDHFTIEGIAREVGFKSKSSFNAAFKSITGLTPSAYKKERSEV